MDNDVQYEQLEQAGARPGGDAVDLTRVSEIPMELSAEIGRTHMTVGEALALRVGSIVTLEHLAGEPADLLVNGTPIARGEVVVIDDKFGLRIIEILDAPERYELGAEAPGAQASGPSGVASLKSAADAAGAEPLAGAGPAAVPEAEAVDAPAESLAA